MSKTASVWDPTTQEVHGGQTWRQLPNFVCDFSVTTNALGTSTTAIRAATEALQEIHHYPAADTKEALDALSKFMGYDGPLLIGNGASEFIDLVMRVGPSGKMRMGPYRASYMEYVRAAKASGRDVVKWDDVDGNDVDVGISVIIRPNSPTGDFMELEELEEVLRNTKGIVVMDESFIMFQGRKWKENSAIRLLEKWGEKLIVIMSWTKVWACPGLRLGSVACGKGWYKAMKKLQTPWSCNTLAQKFFVAACADREYMEKTWDTIPGWRRKMEERIEAMGVKCNKKSPVWVPWVFLDMGSVEAADSATSAAQEAGCPVRNCASFGSPQYIRLGVRAPEYQKVLFAAWEKILGSKN